MGAELKSTVITTMTSTASDNPDKQWLENSLEHGYIRFYPYDEFINSQCIGFGVVFKATAAKSGITVAYKLIINSSEGGFFKDFVNEVCNKA